MIRSYSDKETEKLFQTGHSIRYQNIEHIALRKLDMLNASIDLNALRIPPGNHLEPLLGDRAGQYSIRINDQYRICFRWEGQDAYDVEITDYH